MDMESSPVDIEVVLDLLVVEEDDSERETR